MTGASSQIPALLARAACCCGCFVCVAAVFRGTRCFHESECSIIASVTPTSSTVTSHSGWRARPAFSSTRPAILRPSPGYLAMIPFSISIQTRLRGLTQLTWSTSSWYVRTVTSEFLRLNQLVHQNAFAPFGAVAQPATGNFLTILAALVAPMSREQLLVDSPQGFCS